MFSSCFMLIPTYKKIGVQEKLGGGGVLFFTKPILSYFISRCMLFSTLNKNIEKCPFTYWLNGRWFLQIVDRDSGNLYPIYPLFPCLDIEKCPFTYWLKWEVVSPNGRNFNMKLNGRWFPQIVDRDSGNLYPIYPPFPCSDFWSQVCGGVNYFFVSFWTCWQEISGDRVALFFLEKHLILNSCFLRVLCYEFLKDLKMPLHLLYVPLFVFAL